MPSLRAAPAARRLPRLAGVAAGLLALATACGGGGGVPGPSRLPAEGDAVIFQRILDGQLAAAAGFQQIAESGGFPIETSRGFLFAILDGGFGPYRLSSPSGAFAEVGLRSEAGTAWALVTVASPVGATFRFTTAFGDPVADGWARYVRFDASGEAKLVRTAGAHLERFPGIGGGTISPRMLRVWVPASPPTHVLYAHDGQNLFGPTPFGGWDLAGAAGPATLVVGVDNTAARFDEYTHVRDDFGSGLVGGRAPAYVDYLVDRVVPFVEGRFGAAGRRGVIGSSLGGLVSFEALLRHPDAFDFVASLSGTMGWGSVGAGVHEQTMIEAVAALPACPAATLYLDAGGGPGSGCVDADGDGIEDDTPDSADNYCENAQLARVLADKGCADVTFTWAPDAPHNEGAWRARAPAILDLFEAR